ncbi:MAG: 3-deoxy-manno-octulosonate cytidylyltransferase [Calditrichaeota bacterium]|nr:MAG: 3-deoxy-manno-octulosonate cytidylyltransferase [Calditrichota bacterium]
MEALGIIPARFDSKRFPGKPLAKILNKPMIQWVYEGARKSKLLDKVLVATDDERIVSEVQNFGGEVLLTSPRHPSGTDRVAEVAQKFEVDYVVNIQGDEPLVHGRDIDRVLELMHSQPEVSVATLVTRFNNYEELHKSDTCKVVMDKDGHAIYFSRARIPYVAEEKNHSLDNYFKHVGLYFFTKERLLEFVNLPPSHLEQLERLEQLRFIENGIKVRVVKTQNVYFPVDRQQDIPIVEKYLKLREQSGC